MHDKFNDFVNGNLSRQLIYFFAPQLQQLMSLLTELTQDVHNVNYYVNECAISEADSQTKTKVQDKYVEGYWSS